MNQAAGCLWQWNRNAVRFRWLLVAMVMVVAGCTQKPAPDLKTGAFVPAPIGLKVDHVEAISMYRAPNQAPHVEHGMPYPPEAAAIAWAEQAIQPMGRSRVLRFEVHEASVIESQTKGEAKLFGLMDGESTTHYNGKLVVVFKLYGPASLLPEAELELEVKQSSSVPTHATLQAHEAVFDHISHELVRLLDMKARELMPVYFADYMPANASGKGAPGMGTVAAE